MKPPKTNPAKADMAETKIEKFKSNFDIHARLNYPIVIIKMKIAKTKKAMLEKFKSNFDITIGIFALLFFVFFYFSMIVNINPAEGDIPNYEKLTENDLIEYNKKNNSMKQEMKKYFESGQLKTMEANENRVDLNAYYERTKSPFQKSY